MASESSHDQKHSKGENQSSESTHHAPASASHSFYPAMGYPPSMSYPPPPGQYSGYPAPGYYPYAHAPPAAAYYNATAHQQQRSSGFSRCFFTTIILFTILIFTSSIVTWLILRPQLPVFHVDNFSVSNFNATLPTFTANWEANLTVRNPNTKLTIEFGELQNFVFYEEDYLLASATAPRPFSLETGTSGVINAKLSANNKDNLVENWVLDKLAKERSNGSVSFNFRMLFWTMFRSGLWWKRHLSMKVLCEEIQVAFVGAAGDGNIAANGGRDCLVFV